MLQQLQTVLTRLTHVRRFKLRFKLRFRLNEMKTLFLSNAPLTSRYPSGLGNGTRQYSGWRPEFLDKFSGVLLTKDAEFIRQLHPAGKCSSLTGGGDEWGAVGALTRPMLEISPNLSPPCPCPLLRPVSRDIYSGLNIRESSLYHGRGFYFKKMSWAQKLHVWL